MAVVSEFNNDQQEEQTPVATENSVAQADTVPNPEDAVAADPVDAPRVPNAGNGLDLDNYSWVQTQDEATVTVPVPEGTKSRLVVCEIKRNHLKVGLKGQSPIIDEDLYLPVKTDECFWSIEDAKSISVLLTKHTKMDWWKSLTKGGPLINTEKAEPESKRLSDLDPEARTMVEKMMFDQKQKELGLPTAAEIEQQDMLKKMFEKNPEMMAKFQNAR